MRHDFSGDGVAQAGRLTAWADDLAIPVDKCEIKIEDDDPDDVRVIMTIGDGAEIVTITATQEYERKVFMDWVLTGILVTQWKGMQELGEGPNDAQTMAQFMSQAALWMLDYLEDLDIDADDEDGDEDEPEPVAPKPKPQPKAKSEPKAVPSKRVGEKDKKKREPEPANA